MSITQSPLGAPGLTWDEFCALPEPMDGRHATALIDGEVIWVSAPAPNHQLILANLQFAFEHWMRAGSGRGLAIATPAVKIHDRRGYEADFGWWPETQVTHGQPQPFVGLPVIAVEVWSPSNWRQERLRKFGDYARAGIAELWGIEPGDRRIDVARRPVGGVYDDIADLGPGDELTSPLLDGFTLAVDDLFRW